MIIYCRGNYIPFRMKLSAACIIACVRTAAQMFLDKTGLLKTVETVVLFTITSL